MAVTEATEEVTVEVTVEATGEVMVEAMAEETGNYLPRVSYCSKHKLTSRVFRRLFHFRFATRDHVQTSRCSIVRLISICDSESRTVSKAFVLHFIVFLPLGMSLEILLY